MLGKTIYIWSISSILGGDTAKIVAAVKDGNFDSVILHDAQLSNWSTVARLALTKALKAAGVEVWGGAAVYGANPVWEGQTAAGIVKNYGLASFVFDAEIAFDAVSHPDTAASNLLKAYKAGVSAPVGWCWWAFWHAKGNVNAVYHPKSILWAAMDPNYGNADFGLPMDYWSWGDDAVSAIEYLEESWNQWRAITNKPIIPIGRAYIGDGGTAKPLAMQAFEAKARLLGAVGVGWWSMQHALGIAGVWDELKGLKRFGTAPTPPNTVYIPIVHGATVEERVTDLEARVSRLEGK